MSDQTKLWGFMKHFYIRSIVIMLTLTGPLAPQAMAAASLISPTPPGPPRELTKDEEKSCAMIACLIPEGLSAPECADPLEQYKKLKPHEQPKFLALCPKD
jgi:hypothetical protein